MLNALLGSETAWTLSNEAHIGIVLDEHGQSLLARIATRAQQHIITMFYTMIDLTINHGLFFMYIVFLMIGMMMVMYFLYTLVYVRKNIYLIYYYWYIINLIKIL